MNEIFFNAGRVRANTALAIPLLLCFMSVCNAQEGVVGQEPAGQERPAARQIGEVTTSLLNLQTSGSAAGPALPMLGATSSLSWERYKDSFKHKIPESFERAVSKSNTSGQ